MIAGPETLVVGAVADHFQYFTYQWQFQQARRGYLPTFSEAGLGRAVGDMFGVFRSVGGWWQGSNLGFDPEFVEWVEEQRSKAA